MEGEDIPLDETLFLIVNNLCKEYTGLSPFDIECESFHKVIGLYSDVRRMQIRVNRQTNKPIRRRASDDAGWW